MKSLQTKTSNLLRYVPIAGVVIWACAPGVVSTQTPGQITATRDGSQLTLSWDCVAGRSYQIFSTTDLAVPWEEVATEPKPLVAVGNQLSYAVGVTSETRFYRVAESADTMPAGMVLIPAGTFMMGDTLGDSPENASTEYPVHEVYVSAFYMDQYEVTKALWDEVYTWAVANGYQFDNAGSGKAPDHPVHSVHWYDCVKWCNARSEMEGRVPAYYEDAAHTTVYRSGWHYSTDSNWVKWNAGYRLPTEAEWEKAARGGAEGRRFPWDDTDDITHLRANYRSWGDYDYDVSPTQGYHPDFQSGGIPYTSPVRSFEANGYGLYDMAGNVWEWCWDWCSLGNYGSSPRVDPRGPDGPGSCPWRVVRGAGWGGLPSYCRVAARASDNPGIERSGVGFRSVLPPGQP